MPCLRGSLYRSDIYNYENAVKSFTKQADKLSGDASIQKALHTFAKDVVSAVKKGRRKNDGNIPVQNTAKSRRRIKQRGAGPSQQGRPTKEHNLRLKLFVGEKEDYVSHKLHNKKHKKVKHPTAWLKRWMQIGLQKRIIIFLSNIWLARCYRISY